MSDDIAAIVAKGYMLLLLAVVGCGAESACPRDVPRWCCQRLAFDVARVGSELRCSRIQNGHRETFPVPAGKIHPRGND